MHTYLLSLRSNDNIQQNIVSPHENVLTRYDRNSFAFFHEMEFCASLPRYQGTFLASIITCWIAWYIILVKLMNFS